MAAKFDIANALKAKGFEEERRGAEQGFIGYEYSKKYNKICSNPLQGQWEVTFEVTVNIVHHAGRKYIRACFSNGKVKDYTSDMRAYKAICDTVKYNGFEL